MSSMLRNEFFGPKEEKNYLCTSSYQKLEPKYGFQKKLQVPKNQFFG
jgi:hypothetical protein